MIVSSLSDYDHKDTATGAMYHIAFVSNSALWQSAHCTTGLAAIVHICVAHGTNSKISSISDALPRQPLRRAPLGLQEFLGINAPRCGERCAVLERLVRRDALIPRCVAMLCVGAVHRRSIERAEAQEIAICK
jgi:hypothetical protein